MWVGGMEEREREREREVLREREREREFTVEVGECESEMPGSGVTTCFISRDVAGQRDGRPYRLLYTSPPIVCSKPLTHTFQIVNYKDREAHLHQRRGECVKDGR